jgi:hypothetical protein
MTRTLLYVYGKSRLFLNLQIVSKLLTIPAIMVGIFFGIKAMIIGMIAAGAIEYFMKAYYSGKIAGYPVKNQIKDLLPSAFLALFIGATLSLILYLVDMSPIIILIAQIVTGIGLTILISHLFKIPEYIFIKSIVREKLGDILSRRRNKINKN